MELRENFSNPIAFIVICEFHFLCVHKAHVLIAILANINAIGAS